MESRDVEAGVRFNPRRLRVESQADAKRLLEELGSDKAGIAIMSRKMQLVVVSVENVQARAAHLIKQVMLSKGGECATPRDTFLVDSKAPVRVIMMGTLGQFGRAIKNLSVQPFGLKALSAELKGLLARELGRAGVSAIDAGEHTLVFGGRTLVMGVVNTTPDSFSDGGRFWRFEDARERAIEMARAGADIVDIGGESTRPGADPVSLEEEVRRTVPLIESLAGEVSIPISIDTCKSQVAERALDAGASIINDISALRFDAEMTTLAAVRGAPVIMMHMQGIPRNMQEDPRYDDVVGDISRFLRERAQAAVEGGIEPGKIMVDPGIGFGKTAEHNLEIIRRIDELGSLGYPVVLGASRKRFIGTITGRPADQRVLGTAATVAFAIARGVDVLRVHDVEQMLEVVKVADAVAGRSRPFDGSESGDPTAEESG